MANGKTGRRVGVAEQMQLEEKIRLLSEHNIKLNKEIDRLKDMLQDFIFGVWKPPPTVKIRHIHETEVSDETFNEALVSLLERRGMVYAALAPKQASGAVPFPNPANCLQTALNRMQLFNPDQDELRGIYFTLFPIHKFGEPTLLMVDRAIRMLLSEEPPKPKKITKVLKRSDKLWHPKWKGFRIEDVLYRDPDYLVWMHESDYINLELDVYREAQRRRNSP